MFGKSWERLSEPGRSSSSRGCLIIFKITWLVKFLRTISMLSDLRSRCLPQVGSINLVFYYLVFILWLFQYYYEFCKISFFKTLNVGNLERNDALKDNIASIEKIWLICRKFGVKVILRLKINNIYYLFLGFIIIHCLAVDVRKNFRVAAGQEKPVNQRKVRKNFVCQEKS